MNDDELDDEEGQVVPELAAMVRRVASRGRHLGQVACMACESVPGLQVEIARLSAEVNRLLALLNIREEQATRMRAEIYQLEARLMSGRTTWGPS